MSTPIRIARRHRQTFPKPPPPGVVIHREEAYGDVIMATAIASRLHEQGIKVTFSCAPEIQPALLHHPHLQSVGYHSNPDVNLDNSYESHPDKKNRRIVEMMADSARGQLSKLGIPLDGNHNLTPRLCATKEEIDNAERLLESHTRPFVAFNPTSNSFRNKSVSPHVWAKVESQGTKLWLGTSQAPPGFVDLNIRRWRDLVGVIAVSDLCVSVDTGPLHVAAGLGVPTVAIEQANDIYERILGDQTDWSSVGSDLDCLGCAESVCPIDATNPPCMFPDPGTITRAIERKLSTVNGTRISAIIPVLKPHPRLLRCIDAVKDQVDEIVVTLDGDANVNGFLPDNPKIAVIPNPTGQRTGCSHTLARAIRHSTGRYLLLLNDDAYADPGSVFHLRMAMANDVAVVGALTRYQSGLIYHGGTSRQSWGFGHIDHNKPTDQATIRARTEMEFVNLAFALVLRDAYFEVRGFDQRYDCYAEDSDFCMSVRQAGWKVMYEPVATAIHDEAQSTTSEQKNSLVHEGNSKLNAKWGWYFRKNYHNQLGSFV